MKYACIKPTNSGIRINTDGTWKEMTDNGKKHTKGKCYKSNNWKERVSK